jgi:uncharacterized membrane protein YqjE
MKRLALFLTSWPVMTLIFVGLAILLVWPDDTYRWIRKLWLVAVFPGLLWRIVLRENENSHSSQLR